jgi:hypothetical protein
VRRYDKQCFIVVFDGNSHANYGLSGYAKIFIFTIAVKRRSSEFRQRIPVAPFRPIVNQRAQRP